MYSATGATVGFTTRGRRKGNIYWMEKNQMERQWRWGRSRRENSGSRRSLASALGHEQRYAKIMY